MDDVGAAGAVGDEADGEAELLFDEFDVGAARGGEVGVGADAADVAFPAGEGLEDGAGLAEERGDGEVADLAAVNLVGDADGDLVEVAEDVEDGEGDLGGALDVAAVAGGDAVVPAHAAGASGGGAVFAAVAAAPPELVGGGPEDLGNECAGADCGGVGLGDGDDVGDGVGRDAGPDGPETGESGGGGDHGVDAVVGVLEGAELAFEEDGAAVGEGLAEEGGGVGAEGGGDVAPGAEGGEEGGGVEVGLAVEVLEEDVLGLEDADELLGEDVVVVEELAELESGLGELVGVEGGDAGARGAEGAAGEAFLFVLVEEDVVGHDELGAVGEQQAGGGDAAGDEGVVFGLEDGEVEGDAVGDDVGDVGVEDAGGEGVERELAEVVDDGVAGVGPALEADDDVGLRGEHVGELAFAFVAPVCAYDCLDHGSSFRVTSDELRVTSEGNDE